MNELKIQTHNFEEAKKELMEFAQKNSDKLELETVETKGGLFGWGDHKVTGEEFNERLFAIQSYLIKLNTACNDTIQAFGKVYNTFETLDNDYIKAILISIKAVERTSEGIQVTQEQIKKIVEDQKRTLEVLKKFKQKLDHYYHLGDIDKIWDNYQKCHNEVTVLSNSIYNTATVSKKNMRQIEDLNAIVKLTNQKINDFSKNLNKQDQKLDVIEDFIQKIEKIVHLKDVDKIWVLITDIDKGISGIRTKIKLLMDDASTQHDEIEKLLGFMNDTIGIKHLNDVDEIWNKNRDYGSKLLELEEKSSEAESNITVINEEINELVLYKTTLGKILHLNDVDNIWNSNKINTEQISGIIKDNYEIKALVRAEKENIDCIVTDIIEKNETVVSLFTKKMRTSYIIAGSSLALAVFEFFIILLWVL